MFQVRCAAYQRINHPLIMKNGPRSPLPPPEAEAAPAASRAGWQGCQGTPQSPASRGCAAPQVANQPEQHADLWGAAHEAADGRESVGAVVVGMLPRGYTSPRRARRLGCAGESASSAEQQGRTSSSCLSLRQCPCAGQGSELRPPSIASGCTGSSWEERRPSLVQP